MNENPPVDLQAYLARIGHTGTLAPALASLEALHAAHLAHIPFENVDVRLGLPVRLDHESLQAKLVRGRRGGYCFEHNTLFAAVLRAAGFEVATLEARVRPPGATVTLPRTHMLLAVTLTGRSWLADVGFGGDGPLTPVPMDGTPSEQAEAVYRVQREANGIPVLERLWRGEWRDLYAFSLTPAFPVDFEVANHYTSTHPESIFRRMLTVQRIEPTVRHILRGRTYTVRRGEREEAREIEPAELPALLADTFALEIPEEDALQALG